MLPASRCLGVGNIEMRVDLLDLPKWVTYEVFEIEIEELCRRRTVPNVAGAAHNCMPAIDALPPFPQM